MYSIPFHPFFNVKLNSKKTAAGVESKWVTGVNLRWKSLQGLAYTIAGGALHNVEQDRRLPYPLIGAQTKSCFTFSFFPCLSPSPLPSFFLIFSPVSSIHQHKGICYRYRAVWRIGYTLISTIKKSKGSEERQTKSKEKEHIEVFIIAWLECIQYRYWACDLAGFRTQRFVGGLHSISEESKKCDNGWRAKPREMKNGERQQEVDVCMHSAACCKSLQSWAESCIAAVNSQHFKELQFLCWARGRKEKRRIKDIMWKRRWTNAENIDRKFYPRYRAVHLAAVQEDVSSTYEEKKKKCWKRDKHPPWLTAKLHHSHTFTSSLSRIHTYIHTETYTETHASLPGGTILALGALEPLWGWCWCWCWCYFLLAEIP